MKPTGVRVLIADDSEPLRRRLRALLAEIEGVNLVGEADDARRTLEAVERLSPDLVVLDLRMPGDGAQALQAIARRAPAPKVIVLTAFPWPKTREWCLQNGAAHVFDKGLELQSFLEVLKLLANPADAKARDGNEP